MTVFAISGPEKAGKTTLIGQLTERFPGSRVRHWGPIVSWREMLDPLVEDLNSDVLTFWDRAWPCYVVYNLLMRRPNPPYLWGDPDYWFMAEWNLGRALRLRGEMLILLGPDADTLALRRTPDDLPIAPWDEQAAYDRYALDMAIPRLSGTNPYPEAVRMVERLMGRMNTQYPGLYVPDYCGNPESDTVILGEARSVKDPSDNKMPFTSYYTTRLLIDYPGLMHALATNIDVADPYYLKRKGVILTFGQKADEWATDRDLGHTPLPHPAWLYRWGSTGNKYMEYEHRALTATSEGLVREWGSVRIPNVNVKEVVAIPPVRVNDTPSETTTFTRDTV